MNFDYIEGLNKQQIIELYNESLNISAVNWGWYCKLICACSDGERVAYVYEGVNYYNYYNRESDIACNTATSNHNISGGCYNHNPHWAYHEYCR